MISLFYETDFILEKESILKNWIETSIKEEGYATKELNYIFCTDEYLLDINIRHLQHDYYTDVIGFQYTHGKQLSGDIYISIDRINENAIIHEVSFEKELARVMIHGVLHFMEYKDKTEEDAKKMRKTEDKYLNKLTEIN